MPHGNNHRWYIVWLIIQMVECVLSDSASKWWCECVPLVWVTSVMVWVCWCEWVMVWVSDACEMCVGVSEWWCEWVMWYTTWVMVTAPLVNEFSVMVIVYISDGMSTKWSVHYDVYIPSHVHLTMNILNGLLPYRTSVYTCTSLVHHILMSKWCISTALHIIVVVNLIVWWWKHQQLWNAQNHHNLMSLLHRHIQSHLQSVDLSANLHYIPSRPHLKCRISPWL